MHGCNCRNISCYITCHQCLSHTVCYETLYILQSWVLHAVRYQLKFAYDNTTHLVLYRYWVLNKNSKTCAISKKYTLYIYLCLLSSPSRSTSSCLQLHSTYYTLNCILLSNHVANTVLKTVSNVLNINITEASFVMIVLAVK